MALDKFVDYLQLWQEKMFLGEEFLTWLWLCSEVDNNFETQKGDNYEVWFENSLRLESGQGPTKKSVTCQNSNKDGSSEWAEAFTAVKMNKKVINARIRIRFEEREWALTLPSDTLCPKSVKLLGGADFKDENEATATQAGALIDRMVFFVELTQILEALLDMFLKIRLSDQWTKEELPRLKGWITRWTANED
ncbi:MAG: hypothetical protein LBE80_01330 [Deltaproteobacteria bacterium]|jgi:recombination associated protein RdgC|nr:hypothetical protein [Deltaproteobacteria bacterium]